MVPVRFFFSNILLFVQMHDSNFIIYFTAIIFRFCFLRLSSTCSKITYLVNYSIVSQPILLNNLFRFTFSLVLQINICSFYAALFLLPTYIYYKIVMNANNHFRLIFFFSIIFSSYLNGNFSVTSVIFLCTDLLRFSHLNNYMSINLVSFWRLMITSCFSVTAAIQ